MSNRAVWDVRQRHVWLSTKTKTKRLKRRSRIRIGLQQAIDRRAAQNAAGSEPSAES